MVSGTARPKVTIGLPVYNCGPLIAQAVDSLLSQSYENFELVISDNASTDETGERCRAYAAADRRVQYQRSPTNRGSSWNHNRLVAMARGTYFKWANHDDVCAPTLLERCVGVLDADPGVVLCHSLVEDIDLDGRVIGTHDYRLRTDHGEPSVRYRDLLMMAGGHDLYGVARTDVMRATPPIGSCHRHAERPKVTSIALHGRFHQVREVLFRHSDYPGTMQRTFRTSREIAPVLDPRRANPLIHSTPRLHAEYAAMFVRGIRTAPLPSAQRHRVYRVFLEWLVSRMMARMPLRSREDVVYP
jgi:glycosyltransferase involved in cell wall biosynthesis